LKIYLKIRKYFKKLKGRGILNEENVNASLKEIRIALLEADVNFKVAKDLLKISGCGQLVKKFSTAYSRPANSKNCS